MRNEIINYIRAGYPGLYLVSHEEQRVEAELKAIAESLNFNLFAWSATTGLIDTANGHGREGLNDPFEVISAIAELDENTLVLLRDFHLFLEDGNPLLIRAQVPVFVVATANDVTQLPPELLRKGRWDDMFFVDLPSAAEREQIWRVLLNELCVV